MPCSIGPHPHDDDDDADFYFIVCGGWLRCIKTEMFQISATSNHPVEFPHRVNGHLGSRNFAKEIV